MSVAWCGVFCHGGYGGVNSVFTRKYIHLIICQSSIATSKLFPHLLCTNMGYTEFDCTHLYLGMISFIQLIAFSVLAQLIDSEPIPDDVIHKLVMYDICDHELAPLVGNCHRHHSNADDVV